MLALPLLALGLLPDAPVASAVSQVVPFGPAFDAFQTLLVEPIVSGGDLALTLGHLALLARGLRRRRRAGRAPPLRRLSSRRR